MKTALIIVGAIMVLLPVLSYVCIYIEKQDRDLAAQPFEWEWSIASWLLPLFGVICIIFGIFL